MSQFANFDSPSSQPNPFAATPAYQQPPKRSNAWMWILLGVGGTTLVVCCGCVGLFALGLSQVGNQIEAQLNADPTAQQHLGTVQSSSIDWAAIGPETERAGESVMVWQVKGDKGTGKVRARQSPGGTFQDATLILPSGEEVDLGF
jgi:hypothetical protein